MIIPARKPSDSHTHAVDTATSRTLCDRPDLGMLAARSESVNCSGCVSTMAAMAQSSDRAYTLDRTLTIEFRGGQWFATARPEAGGATGVGSGGTAAEAVANAITDATGF